MTHAFPSTKDVLDSSSRVILDTAGRYAVPDNDKRDRQEWTFLMQMLSRHKQKEPLNGLVLVVTADRLINDSDEELRAEGQQIRAGINELMERLEIQMPVYLMVTKCDLVSTSGYEFTG